MDRSVNGRGRQGRSPAFPFISLPKAIARAEELRATEGKNGVPITSAYRAWGFGGKSSGGRQTAAALRHFGLLEYVGRGDERDVQLTKLALDILLDTRPRSPEREALIRRAALNPPIHAELWRRYGAELPSDATFQTYLVRDRGFNESGARDLIDEYKDTLAFAKLVGGAAAEPAPPQVAEARHALRRPQRQEAFDLLPTGPATTIEAEPAPVSDLNGDDVAPQPAAEDDLWRPPALGMRQDVFTLDEGEVLIRWPECLSRESYEDLEQWLQLVLRRAKRSVKSPTR